LKDNRLGLNLLPKLKGEIMEKLFEEIERLFDVKNGDMSITNIDQWRKNQLQHIKKRYLSNQVEAQVGMPSELLPCPFCGEKKWLYIRENYIDGFFVECRGCSLHSPPFNNDKLAKEFWNRRAYKRSAG